MPRDLYIYTHEFFPKRGGIASYCQEFASGAARLGKQVTVFAPKNASNPEHGATPYHLQPCSNRGTHNFPCLCHTRSLLRKQLKHAPNGLHLLAEPGPILAYGMLKKAQAAGHVMLTLHGSEIERWKSNPCSKFLAERAFQRATAIQVVSTPVLSALVRYFPETRNKAQVNHSALPEYFRESSRRFVREVSPTAHQQLHILSVGRIHPRKGFEHLIQAIALLQKGEQDAYRLTIAGGAQKASYLARLKQLAKKLNVAVNWVLDPSNQDLAVCYRSADLFALTSLERKHSIEGYGLVFLEAAAFALPCIAYASGGMVDAIKHEKTGFLVPPGNWDQLADRIHFMHNTPAVRVEMGHLNQSFARSRTWKDVVTKATKHFSRSRAV